MRDWLIFPIGAVVGFGLGWLVPDPRTFVIVMAAVAFVALCLAIAQECGHIRQARARFRRIVGGGR